MRNHRLDFCFPLAQSPFHNLPLSSPPAVPPPPPSPLAFRFCAPPIPLKAPAPPLFFPAVALAPEAENGARLVLHPPPSLLPAPSLAAGSSKPVRAQLSSTPAPPAPAPATLDMKTNFDADTVVLPEAREPERAW